MCEREISDCEKLWKYLIAIQIVEIVFLVAFLAVFLVVFLLVFLVLFLIVFQILFLIISMSSSYSSSPALTKLLCQRVVFRNILSANNLQKLQKEMLSIHVLSFLFFCLFVRPSACLAVFLFSTVASFPRMVPNYETTLLFAKGRSLIAKNCENT